MRKCVLQWSASTQIHEPHKAGTPIRPASLTTLTPVSSTDGCIGYAEPGIRSRRATGYEARRIDGPVTVGNTVEACDLARCSAAAITRGAASTVRGQVGPGRQSACRLSDRPPMPEESAVQVPAGQAAEVDGVSTDSPSEKATVSLDESG